MSYTRLRLFSILSYEFCRCTLFSILNKFFLELKLSLMLGVYRNLWILYNSVVQNFQVKYRLLLEISDEEFSTVLCVLLLSLILTTM